MLRYGVFGVFVIMIATFGVLRTQDFLQLDTLKEILVNASVLAVVASGLTLVLAIGEFDLSFGSVAGFAGAVVVYMMYKAGLPLVPALAVALVAGLVAGLANGVIVAYGKVPALIATLAVGSVAEGVERWIFNDETIYEGIPHSFLSITNTSVFGFQMIVPISIVVVIALCLICSFTTFGRRVFATGGSEEAARIAGIRTRRVRTVTFILMGLGAGIAGILLMSQASSYYPNSGTGLLLPAYAACFLGWSAAGADRFYPAYTYFGVLFIGTLSTGLIMLQVASWVTDVVQGVVLVSAVLVARAARTS